MESRRYKITVNGHSKIQDHVVYKIKIEKDGKTILFYERYSNLKSYHDQLKKETNNNSLPKFPPKKFFGSEDEKFLTKRQDELNTYFESICSNDEFTSLPSFKKFIDNATKNNINTAAGAPSQPPQEQPKKAPEAKNTINEINTKVTKEIKNSKNEEEEYSKIVNEYIKKYIDMGYVVEQEINEDREKKYSKLFSEVKLTGGNSEMDKILSKEGGIDAGNDNNFNLIGQEDSSVTDMEKDLQEKMEKILKDFKNFDEVYNTSKLIVPI